ncbi:putative drug exporter of the RND superfamily [Virgibacillus subterraneus]|uniref:Drug exporter of the RND superfamily n=1 Tax=Virgibacillus subterraneus TaxID=621109 RepID=A0A1H9GH21_9BACI|nr:MMPL family transporter [Virgibacillus subterraneus]SEQ49323.1 putative drug exporter of the RND superfamily [Virgibacillus subterraneus]
MKQLFRMINSKQGLIIVLSVWLIIVIALGFIAPGAKEFAGNSSGAGLPRDAQSVIADGKVNEHFEGSDVLPAILVFHQKKSFDEASNAAVGDGLASINEEKIEGIDSIIPFNQMNMEMQQSFLSDDETTLVLPVHLEEGLEMDEINEIVVMMEKTVQGSLSEGIELSVTGPAGISSDALELFSSGDMVLLFSTIGLILVLLIVIYRSPLLALIPLIASGIVYEVVNRTIGLAGENGWFTVESQALSIMMILLFAAITDYSLFIFSRFREELQTVESKYEAMQRVMSRVGEPIFFSGGTVLVAVITLSVAIFEPYRNFAPVFSVAMFFILLAGLTLVPALFTLFGRRSFWPVIPRVEKDKQLKTNKVWEKISHAVTRKPLVTGISVLALLILFSLNTFNISYSYNLLQSFPEDMSSREGFELIEEKYTPGEVAPTTVVITSNDAIEKESINPLVTQLEEQGLIESVTFNDRDFISEDSRAAKLTLVFSENPYTHEVLNAMEELRDNKEDILDDSGFNQDEADLYFAGETAKNLDVRSLNNRDTMVVMVLVTIFITIMLGFQSRSIIAPIYMMATILLSYSAALGISDLIFKNVFDLQQMSYRIPIYAFVFLVALGVDYNIMLVSRIQEAYKNHSLKEAVKQGIARTGGVISSAGLILAATFAVLTTQPILELFMFGFVVALGVLIDTFLVRTILTPAIILKLGKWSFWPGK